MPSAPPRQSQRRRPAARPMSAPPELILMMRSPMLAALPRPRTAGRRRRIIVRLTCWSVLLVGAVRLWVNLRREALGQSQLAQLLYRLHDTLFLPIKGYSYTLFLPTSMIWYGIPALLFALWLGWYVLDRSLVRRPQIRLLRFFVARRLLSFALLACARRLLRFGVPPDLIQAVAEYQRTLAMLDYAAAPNNRPATLIHLTRLLIRLRLLRATPIAALQAACDWQDTLLLLRRCGMRQLPAPLLAECRPIVDGALRSAGRAPIGAFDAPRLDLDLSSGLADLLRQYLLVGGDPALLVDVHTAPHIFAHAEIEQIQVQTVEQRRRQLDSVRGRLEAALAYPATVERAADASIFAPGVADAALPLLGALALRSALLTALETRSASLALGAIEAVEALAGIGECVRAVPLPAALADTARRARAWTQGLPAPQDYQIAALLAAEERAYQPWPDYLTQEDAAVQPLDAALSSERLAIFVQAAGDAGPALSLMQQDKQL